MRNLGGEDVTFALAAADGYFTPTGRFTMLASDQPSVAAGTWIALQESVRVEAGGSAVIPFTVAVPDDATPGDHAAGVAASITTVSSGGGAAIGVESRVGFRVITRVTGEVAPGLAVGGGGTYRATWNPFAPGSIEVVADLENTGNIRLDVDPSVVFGEDPIGAACVAEDQAIELLPGDRRTVRFTVPAVWPTGAIGIPLRAEARATASDGSSIQVDPVVRELSVWALPVPQVIVVLALGLVAAGALIGRRRQGRRVERMLLDAREEGRREALSTGWDTDRVISQRPDASATL